MALLERWKSRKLLFTVTLFGTVGIIALMFYTSVSHNSRKMKSYTNIRDDIRKMESYTNLSNKIRKMESRGMLILLDWTGNKRHDFKEHMVDNCLVTRNRSLLLDSNAVVITHRRQWDIEGFPKFRHSWQKWVWLMDESPSHTFAKNNYRFKNIQKTFNWTMTYRTTSDVYIPYGWIRRRETPADIPHYIGNKTKLAAAVVSNCVTMNGRYEYLQNLTKLINVDIYGRCSGKKCDGHNGRRITTNCEKVRDYLFYFAFENSNCKEYITEKAFSHGFNMGTVPVVMGAPKADYIAITPPNSIIHVSDFSGPVELGQYLIFLSKNRTEYMKYHEWRRKYRTTCRIQYMTDEPLWIPLCEALNKDDGHTKIYEDLGDFWTTRDCN